MSNHKALNMFGRSGNPSLNAQTFSDSAKDATFSSQAPASTMTLEGTVNKTGILLALVVVSAFYTWSLFFSSGSPAAVMPIAISGAIVGFILALVTIFKTMGRNNSTPLRNR